MNLTVKLFLYLVAAGCLAYSSRGLINTLNTPAPAPPSAATNSLAATNAPAAGDAAPAVEDGQIRKPAVRMGRMMSHIGLIVLSLAGLAVLFANDLSRFVAHRVEDFIFNDDLKGVRDPEYEEAEELWKRGQHLESIQLMRDYLKRHPRELYVALRIAEIYETDLRNYLAAALEYEEVLKKRLPAERWGWAAIHLANIYSGKLDKTEEATLLLRRIIEEFGQTAAAKKARERLGIPHPVETVEVAAPVVAAAAGSPAPVIEPSKAPSPNLPPGFRPK